VPIQLLVDEARRVRTGPVGDLVRSPVLVVCALRTVLACLVASNCYHMGDGPLRTGARILAATIADLEDSIG